jgi:large subunit ribosomal protein L5
MRAHIEKIVVNAGVGRASTSQQNFEEKLLPQIMKDLARMTGQKAEPRPAKKSIAGFKIREGQVVGLRVTLRGARMVDFFTRLNTIVLPRVRDFAGIATSAVDDGGSLNVGFREQLVFPEVNPEESIFVFPLAVNVVVKKKDRAAALELYRKLGVPFKKEKGGSSDL